MLIRKYKHPIRKCTLKQLDISYIRRLYTILIVDYVLELTSACL